MLSDLLTGFAIFLVLEGLLPAVAPQRFQRMLEEMRHVDPEHLRIMGLVLMVFGALLLLLR